jgi:rhamnosyltransferase subunit B
VVGLKKIVIGTLGSLGDVHPLLAVAKACRDLQLEVVFAANASFRQAIAGYGVDFAEMGATKDDMVFPEMTTQEAAVPFVEQALRKLDEHFDALMRIAADADAILSPFWVLAAHLVATKLEIPFLTCTFSPAYLVRKSWDGGGTGARVKVAPHWHARLANLRQRAGLCRVPLPYAEAFTAASAMLGLYPQFLSQQMLAGARSMLVCGYPHLQQQGIGASDGDLLDFCDDRTVTFSFGSYVDALHSQELFDESVAACRKLGLKCLYISAFVTETGEPDSDVLVRGYVDHDTIFARSAIVVHHAGMGTLMSACRSRAPMVCVPSIYDQLHNAARLSELIGAPRIRLAEYARKSLADALQSVSSERNAMVDKLHTLMDRESDGAPVAAAALSRVLSEGVSRPGERILDSTRAGLGRVKN